MNGNVFDIKKFAVHDGPGIRTTLFLKGCPLKCIWCHNPEGIDTSRSLWYFEKKCIKCDACLTACTYNALSSIPEDVAYIKINQMNCIRCGSCVEVCPTSAIRFDSYEADVETVVETLLQDKSFYAKSGGGITISGGDPLFQADFSKAVLYECKEANIHTAIETSMCARRELLESFIGLVDLFIVDIKLFDPNEHKKYTGADNKLILSNFEMLSHNKQKILVRIPLIPQITTTSKNIESIGRFVFETSPETAIELINFNPLAENKYRLLGQDYRFLAGMKPFSNEKLDYFYSLLTNTGVKTVRETVVS